MIAKIANLRWNYQADAAKEVSVTLEEIGQAIRLMAPAQWATFANQTISKLAQDLFKGLQTVFYDYERLPQFIPHLRLCWDNVAELLLLPSDEVSRRVSQVDDSARSLAMHLIAYYSFPTGSSETWEEVSDLLFFFSFSKIDIADIHDIIQESGTPEMPMRPGDREGYPRCKEVRHDYEIPIRLKRIAIKRWFSFQKVISEAKRGCLWREILKNEKGYEGLREDKIIAALELLSEAERTQLRRGLLNMLARSAFEYRETSLADKYQQHLVENNLSHQDLDEKLRSQYAVSLEDCDAIARRIKEKPVRDRIFPNSRERIDPGGVFSLVHGYRPGEQLVETDDESVMELYESGSSYCKRLLEIGQKLLRAGNAEAAERVLKEFQMLRRRYNSPLHPYLDRVACISIAQAHLKTSQATIETHELTVFLRNYIEGAFRDTNSVEFTQLWAQLWSMHTQNKTTLEPREESWKTTLLLLEETAGQVGGQLAGVNPRWTDMLALFAFFFELIGDEETANQLIEQFHEEHANDGSACYNRRTTETRRLRREAELLQKLGRANEAASREEQASKLEQQDS